MSGHHAHRGLPPRRSARPVITAATAAFILLAAGACTSSTSTSTGAPAVAVASNGPAGHKPALTRGAQRTQIRVCATAIAAFFSWPLSAAMGIMHLPNGPDTICWPTAIGARCWPSRRAYDRTAAWAVIQRSQRIR